jgi:hypothetical protein
LSPGSVSHWTTCASTSPRFDDRSDPAFIPTLDRTGRRQDRAPRTSGLRCCDRARTTAIYLGLPGLAHALTHAQIIQATSGYSALGRPNETPSAWCSVSPIVGARQSELGNQVSACSGTCHGGERCNPRRRWPNVPPASHERPPKALLMRGPGTDPF